MMKKEKTLRMAVTGALLLTVVAAGISMYRTDTTPPGRLPGRRRAGR